MLAERFGWHPLDLEDVLSKRQRPKVDEYPDYLFGVLHFPVYDKAVQRLNAAELDFFEILADFDDRIDELERENAENHANCKNERTAQNPGVRRSIHELSFELPKLATERASDTSATRSPSQKSSPATRNC